MTCDSTTGLPWASHDGYPRDADTTGKYLKGDRPRADGVTLNTAALALAWWFSSAAGTSAGAGHKYLERAAFLLRVFFLDPKTRMNPNMNYAQGVPGRFDGGVGGTVDFGRLWMLLDAVRLIETSPTETSPWTKSDRDGFRTWLTAMLEGGWALQTVNKRGTLPKYRKRLRCASYGNGHIFKQWIYSSKSDQQ